MGVTVLPYPSAFVGVTVLCHRGCHRSFVFFDRSSLLVGVTVLPFHRSSVLSNRPELLIHLRSQAVQHDIRIADQADDFVVFQYRCAGQAKAVEQSCAITYIHVWMYGYHRF